MGSLTPDVQILGGGILGVLTALLASERGLRVVLYRLSDRKVPNADSLRNHAWLQSGLHYARSLPKEVVLRMYHSGFDLFGRFVLLKSEKKMIRPNTRMTLSLGKGKAIVV